MVNNFVTGNTNETAATTPHKIPYTPTAATVGK
jgi:hypothetical protein